MERKSRREPPAGDDWWAMGELFSLTIDQVAAPVEGMHRAIAARWFRMAGSPGESVGRGYDTVTKAVYGTVRFGAAALGAVVPAAASLIKRRNTGSARRRLSGGLQATANALWGDQLDARDSQLAIAMGFRNRDGDPIDLSAIGDTYRNPSGRLIILLHGLGETERGWLRHSTGSPSLADLLSNDGMSPIFLRYNTGLRISDNGELLARLVDKLLEDWPTPVISIDFVGHSMGGLVARSAVSSAASQKWANLTRHLVTLGTPHLGSPLEKGANFLAWGLDVTPESQPLGEFLRGRSAGIKDLRFGTTEDAEKVDPSVLVDQAAASVAPPPGVAQHFVAGVVTRDATHPVGALVGDLVVRVGSATGVGRHRRVEASDVLVVGRQRHFDLPADPAVHAHIRSWLAT